MSVNIDQILNEVKRFVDQNPKILQGAIMSPEITLNKRARLVTKVRGEYPSVTSLMGNVVQQFSTDWTETSNVQFRGKVLKNYHQKINFAFTPAEILGSWIEQKYNEGVDVKDKEISKHVMTLLAAKIVSDVNYLSISGVYDPAQPTVYGKSMNGMNQIDVLLQANTDNPCFKIPTDAIDDTNILDVVLEFEKRIPEYYKPFIKEIEMSVANAENHKLRYEEQYGGNTDYAGDRGMRTRLGNRTIVATAGMPNTYIKATIDWNLIRLVDVVENPATITDVQKQDYKIKIFGEFSLGYDYAVNELVLVSDPVGSTYGLGNTALNKLYYPGTF